MLAHNQLGMVLWNRSELTAAQTHHAQALALYDSQAHRALAVRYGTDPGVVSHAYLALELWYLGTPDQALPPSQAARTLAEEVAHPSSQTQALIWVARMHPYRREVAAAQAQAAAARTLATEQGLAQWVA
jgi:hypothetical protein